MRKVQVTFVTGDGSTYRLLFNDFYDLADWLKQKNLAGQDATIRKWEYVG